MIPQSTLQQMIFIYNAINDGWSVKKLSEKVYEFSKSKEEASSLVLDESSVANFVEQHINLQNIMEKEAEKKHN